MGTVTIIVLGVVAITVISVVGDMVSKVAQARIKSRAAAGGGAAADEIEGLKRRIGILESRVEEREDAVKKLQEEVRFVSRLLEDKSGGRRGT